MNAAECAARGVKVHRQAAENVDSQTCQERQEQTGAKKTLWQTHEHKPGPPTDFLTKAQWLFFNSSGTKSLSYISSSV